MGWLKVAVAQHGSRCGAYDEVVCRLCGRSATVCLVWRRVRAGVRLVLYACTCRALSAPCAEF